MKIKYFELAKKVSRKSDHHSYHIGAVIVNKNKILNVGFNRLKTHPKSNHPFQHLHAEIDCLLGLDYEILKGSTMYIFRQDKQGDPALSRSCSSCMAAIRVSGIKYLCYTGNKKYIKERVK